MMKKNNNLGFLLAESLIVSTFVIIFLILLFVQFKMLFNDYLESYDYNTVEGIYNLNTMKKYIIDNETTSLQEQMKDGYTIIAQNGSCNKEIGLTGISYCDQLITSMNLKTLLYTKSDISSLDTSNEIFTQKFKSFIKRIENNEDKSRLIGQFKDGTYATLVFEYKGSTIAITDHLVTYDYTTNGGESTNAKDKYVGENEAVDLSYTASKTSYKFVGWNTDASASEGLTKLTMGTENITLYAIFKYVDEIAPTIEFSLGDNAKGNNNWYKSLTINAKVTDNEEISSAKYCITTSTCTPNKELTLTGNIGSVQLDSDTAEQKICVSATDKTGNETSKCSDGYKVDNTVPKITNMTVTPDDNTVTITLEANDNHSGLYMYYYSKDSGTTYISSPNPNYTFTSLDEGDYLVTAYIEDKAGNNSETMAKSTTIRYTSFCEKNGITDLGNCIIATEAGNEPDIIQAKAKIEIKGIPNYKLTTPSIIYSEKHMTTLASISSTTYRSIANSYTFDPATGYYTLVSPTLTDPETIDFNSGKDYYLCGNSNPSCPNLLKITNVFTTIDDTTGTKTYQIEGYTYDASVTSYDNSESGLYAANDDSGISYYYRGAVAGNYVKFGGYYWRIIRVNGDGSVRLIYDGTKAWENGVGAADRQVATSAFNSWYSDNAYFGYMYGDPSNYQITEMSVSTTQSSLSTTSKYYFATSYTFDKETNTFALSGDLVTATIAEYKEKYLNSYLYSCFSTSSTGTCQKLSHIQNSVGTTSMAVKFVEYSSTSYEQAHKNTMFSTMKLYLDGWYINNLSSLSSKISKEAIFCNNRTPATGYQNAGYGLNSTYYTSFERFYGLNGNSPTGPNLVCPNDNDKFTVSASSGNGSLIYPIGIISADEVNMAGGKPSTQNTLYYLYSGAYYWTMSPASFGNGDANGFYVTYAGALNGYNSINQILGVRPVINLDASKISFTGTGTLQDPYVIS